MKVLKVIGIALVILFVVAMLIASDDDMAVAIKQTIVAVFQ